MKTDQELLEAAAKAAGIDFDGNIARHKYSSVVWNPLTDDGDALRLAVKLRIDIDFEEEDNLVHAWLPSSREPIATRLINAGDDGEATRRVIVLAAAQNQIE